MESIAVFFHHPDYLVSELRPRNQFCGIRTNATIDAVRAELNKNNQRLYNSPGDGLKFYWAAPMGSLTSDDLDEKTIEDLYGQYACA